MTSEILHRFHDWQHKLDCRYLPHGPFTLVPAVLSTMAFWTTLGQDGCDFARLSGNSVENITSSDVIPFIEIGRNDYRAPLYYAENAEWDFVYTEECTEYPPNISQDRFWTSSKWLVFLSAVIGGALALFLWFVICFTVSKRTWRLCAVVAIIAAILRTGSFFFFLTDICKQGTCELDFGSRMDIIAIVLWIVSAFCMAGYYPNPKLRRLTNDELEEELEREMAQTYAMNSKSAEYYDEDDEFMSLSPRKLGSGEDSKWKKKIAPFEYPSINSRAPSKGRDERTVATKKTYGEESSFADKTYFTEAGQSHFYAQPYAGGSRVYTPQSFAADENRPYTPQSYAQGSFM